MLRYHMYLEQDLIEKQLKSTAVINLPLQKSNCLEIYNQAK
jgi:hypothetical protein